MRCLVRTYKEHRICQDTLRAVLYKHSTEDMLKYATVTLALAALGLAQQQVSLVEILLYWSLIKMSRNGVNVAALAGVRAILLTSSSSLD